MGLVGRFSVDDDGRRGWKVGFRKASDETTLSLIEFNSQLSSGVERFACKQRQVHLNCIAHILDLLSAAGWTDIMYRVQDIAMTSLHLAWSSKLPRKETTKFVTCEHLQRGLHGIITGRLASAKAATVYFFLGL